VRGVWRQTFGQHYTDRVTRSQSITYSTWRVMLAVLVFAGLGAVLVYEGASAPIWAIVVAALFAVAAVPAGVWVARQEPGKSNSRLALTLMIAAAALGPVLVGAPERIMIVVLAFLMTFVLAVMVDVRVRQRREPHPEALPDRS
jgi:uncharacterized membrane protein